MLQLDIWVQYILLAATIISAAATNFGWPYFVMAFTSWCYQLVTGIVELKLNHKSIGFKPKRLIHLAAIICYPFLIAASLYLSTVLSHNTLLLVYVPVYWILPFIVSVYYLWLSHHEQQFLLHREFFILK